MQIQKEPLHAHNAFKVFEAQFSNVAEKRRKWLSTHIAKSENRLAKQAGGGGSAVVGWYHPDAAAENANFAASVDAAIPFRPLGNARVALRTFAPLDFSYLQPRASEADYLGAPSTIQRSYYHAILEGEKTAKEAKGLADEGLDFDLHKGPKLP
jgi:hypothetical protein